MGRTRSVLPANAELVVCGRNVSFCRWRPQAAFALIRVRIGRFTPPARLSECAQLLGGSELCPVSGPAASPVAPALHGRAFPEQGLEAMIRVRSFSNADKAYATWSW